MVVQPNHSLTRSLTAHSIVCPQTDVATATRAAEGLNAEVEEAVAKLAQVEDQLRSVRDDYDAAVAKVALITQVRRHCRELGRR